MLSRLCSILVVASFVCRPTVSAAQVPRTFNAHKPTKKARRLGLVFTHQKSPWKGKTPATALRLWHDWRKGSPWAGIGFAVGLGAGLAHDHGATNSGIDTIEAQLAARGLVDIAMFGCKKTPNQCHVYQPPHTVFLGFTFGVDVISHWHNVSNASAQLIEPPWEYHRDGTTQLARGQIIGKGGVLLGGDRTRLRIMYALAAHYIRREHVSSRFTSNLTPGLDVGLTVDF